MRIVSNSPQFNSDFKAGNTLHHLLYRAGKYEVLRFVIMIVAFHLVCVCTIMLFLHPVWFDSSSGLLQGGERMWQEADRQMKLGILFNI